MTFTLLIVEDEPEITELLTLYLEKEYHLLLARDGLEAISIIKKHKVHLAILDVMMPRMDGFQLIKEIRKEHHFPVLFLSARINDHDKILGLNLGADDYIGKPFNPLEIVARVNSALRRVYRFNQLKEPDSNFEQILLGDLLLDLKECTLMKEKQMVPLTSTEYKILSLFMKHPGRVFTHKNIYETIWESTFAYDNNTIMVHISNIREKIEDNPKKPLYLKTIRGLGYKFETPLEK
ncbi:response regulator transcription factor [Bacillus sp. JJ722]|uniref:response regulator transcription factor n=1 Tax=Bacillus sp. JJ722 TaxID=3122973 RepID=UPI002FFF8D98